MNITSANKFIHIILVLCFLSLLSCSSFQRTISNEEDRKAELYSHMQKVKRSYRWLTFEELAEFFSKEISLESLHDMHKFYKDKKVKEVNVEQIDFEEEANKAYLILEVKTFSAPRYLIDTHLDQISWKYSISGGGWQITKIDVGSVTGEDDAE